MLDDASCGARLFAYWADVGLNLRTGFYTPRVARRYATSFLALDVLSALPLAPPVHAVDGEAPAERLLLLLRLLRLLRLVGVSRVRRATALPPIGAAQYLHAFERLFNAFHPAVLRLLGLALTLVLFCHWLGCGWWLVSEIEGVESCMDGCAAGRGARAAFPPSPSPPSTTTPSSGGLRWRRRCCRSRVSDGEIVYTQLSHPPSALRGRV